MIALALAAVLSGSPAELQRCGLETKGLPRVDAKCGAIRVDDGIEIGFALLEADLERPLPDPVVFLPGGPGQAATQLAPYVEAVLRPARSKRNVILFDPRGTGRSTPFVCKDERDLAARLRASDDEERARVAACAKHMPFDPARVTTERIARDLEALRIALRVERMNLLGVSYGTRIALAYDRLFPGRVRTLVLDGVVPSTMRVGERAAEDALAALDALDARCSKSALCKKEKTLRSIVEETHARLRARPAEVTIPDPSTARPITLRIDDRAFIGMVRAFLYTEETAALLAPVLRAVDGGDLSSLAAQIALHTRTLDLVNVYVYASVLCAEDAPFTTPSDHMFDVVSDMKSLCAVWPHAKIEKPVASLVSSTPALLLSGSADPVTPPRYAQEAAKELTHSMHLVVHGGTHNVSLRGCLPKLVASFIDAGSHDALDVSCAKKLGPFPLFVDALGPAP